MADEHKLARQASNKKKKKTQTNKERKNTSMVHTTEPQIGTASSNPSCFGPIATTHAQNDKPFRKCPCSERETIVSMHRMHC